MALTTQCPLCKTTFRVAADQLKLRGGMVRCGSCNGVFDGNAALLNVAAAPEIGSGVAEQPAKTPEKISSKPLRLSKYSSDVWREPSFHSTPEAAPVTPVPAAPDLHYLGPERETAHVPIKASPKVKASPNIAPLAVIHTEPGFVRQGRRRERSGKLLRWIMGIGCFLLLLALLAQGLFTFRNQLAAQVPAFAPALHAACAIVQCRIDLPAQIEQLSIEQGELQTVAEHTYSYATVLHNQGRGAQAWPALELILIDTADQPVLRRVFVPAEYLAAPEKAGSGMAGHSEQAIKLYFDLAAIKAAGYHIAIFYP